MPFLKRPAERRYANSGNGCEWVLLVRRVYLEGLDMENGTTAAKCDGPAVGCNFVQGLTGQVGELLLLDFG